MRRKVPRRQHRSRLPRPAGITPSAKHPIELPKSSMGCFFIYLSSIRQTEIQRGIEVRTSNSAVIPRAVPDYRSFRASDPCHWLRISRMKGTAPIRTKNLTDLRAKHGRSSFPCPIQQGDSRTSVCAGSERHRSRAALSVTACQPDSSPKRGAKGASRRALNFNLPLLEVQLRFPCAIQAS